MNERWTFYAPRTVEWVSLLSDFPPVALMGSCMQAKIVTRTNSGSPLTAPLWGIAGRAQTNFELQNLDRG